MSSRRSFLVKTVSGIAGATTIPFIGNTLDNRIATGNHKVEKLVFQVGIAGYTFHKFNVEQSILMMKRVGVSNLSIKDFHLPLDSNQELIGAVLSQFKNAGIDIYTVGVIYMKSKEEVDKAFNYAKNVGVEMIVGVPTYDLLDYTENKIKETNIKVAIHNHGPEDKSYPSPKDAFERIKNRDPRMGLCIDIGHSMRAGMPPEKAILDFKDRLFDLHIKDVDRAAKDAEAIELGRGIINIPAVVDSLRKINYQGICSIEYEKDMSDPLPGIAESIGFFKGVMKAG